MQILITTLKLTIVFFTSIMFISCSSGEDDSDLNISQGSLVEDNPSAPIIAHGTNQNIIRGDNVNPAIRFIGSGGTPTNCSMTPALADVNVAINGTGCQITGTVNASATLGTKTYTITATNGAGNDTGAVDITVEDIPKVINVTSTTTDGTYGIGYGVAVTVEFNKNVTVTGAPQLEMETNNTPDTKADYVSGSGGATLIFTYTVVDNDATAD
ncbi:MAG: hypothetical protein DRQ51_04950, partial [Gammaproteobacteria bacterium]